MEQEIGRLALRREGDFWNAYYALSDTMDDAILLGSIGMGFVMANEGIKLAFMEIMKAVVNQVIEEKTGRQIDFNDPQIAPEHERSGHS